MRVHNWTLFTPSASGLHLHLPHGELSEIVGSRSKKSVFEGLMSNFVYVFVHSRQNETLLDAHHFNYFQLKV